MVEIQAASGGTKLSFGFRVALAAYDVFNKYRGCHGGQ